MWIIFYALDSILCLIDPNSKHMLVSVKKLILTKIQSIKQTKPNRFCFRYFLNICWNTEIRNFSIDSLHTFVVLIKYQNSIHVPTSRLLKGCCLPAVNYKLGLPKEFKAITQPVHKKVLRFKSFPFTWETLELNSLFLDKQRVSNALLFIAIAFLQIG